jgi:2-polyprenyl-3-methyl-5-hydroxy-6-metoxy-1,4-benzoquinol methylase/glycosyltransferase involved in cell wall biosynthesis
VSSSQRGLGTRVDEQIVQALDQRRAELARALPAIGLFLFGCADRERLRQTLERIPAAAAAWLREVVVVPQPTAALGMGDIEELARSSRLPVRLHRDPRDSGYGGARRAAFEYALVRGFDYAIQMRGDGLHPPEALPGLLYSALADGQRVVIASRLLDRAETLRAGMTLARLAAHALATGFQNRALGLSLSDYHSSYRLYAASVLRAIPFQLNATDRRFETQILIQCRALGVPLREVPVLPAWKEYGDGYHGLREVVRGCVTAVDYRLHQMHITRRGCFFVEQDVHYTLKRSPTGSHMQIVDSIRPGSFVLDLGCSQGLLAGPLREKNVRTIGVDSGPPERLSAELEAYYRRDLEQPLELPLGRVFDYVVVADVIEHLRQRTQLMRSARRFLKQDGRLIISTPNVALWFYRLSLLAGRFEYGPRGVLDETHVRLYTGASFRREVERAGFQVIHRRVTALPFEVVFQSTGRSRLVRVIAEAYHLLARAWPSLFAYQFILEAEIITLDHEATVPPPEPGDA